MQAIQKAHPILLTLVKIQRKYNKDYSWPSQLKLMELMDIRQGIQKSKATLNRWLAEAQENKYLMRRRRIKNNPILGHLFQSTLYKITIKGYRLLATFGVDVSREIEAYEKWLEEINPGYKALKTRKMLETVKRNSRHEENMAEIVSKLNKLNVVL